MYIHGCIVQQVGQSEPEHINWHKFVTRQRNYANRIGLPAAAVVVNLIRGGRASQTELKRHTLGTPSNDNSKSTVIEKTAAR